MQTILMFLNGLTTIASSGMPSSPPSGDSQGPSSMAIFTLICGIASWLFLPLIASIVGILVGRSELKAIREGRSPASGEMITKIGYYVCIANILMTVVGGCVTTVFVFAIYAGLIASVGGLALFSEIAQYMP